MYNHLEVFEICVLLKSICERKTMYKDNHTFMEGRCSGFFQGSNEIIGVETFVSERSWCMSKNTHAGESGCQLTSIQRINVPQQILLFYFLQCLHYVLSVIRLIFNDWHPVKVHLQCTTHTHICYTNIYSLLKYKHTQPCSHSPKPQRGHKFHQLRL